MADLPVNPIAVFATADPARADPADTRRVWHAVCRQHIRRVATAPTQPEALRAGRAHCASHRNGGR